MFWRLISSYNKSKQTSKRDRQMRVRVMCTYLFVELDVGGLELLLDVSLGTACSEVIRELVVRVAHASRVLSGSVVGDGRLRDGVERHSLVFGVPDLVQVDVGDLLVCDKGWVVRRRVSGKLGEVLGCHG